MSLYFQSMFGVKIMNPMEVAEIKKHVNPLVIYHAKCADGFSAAWVFHHIQDKIETAFDFHPGIYNEDPPDVSDRIVYLVDFSYKREVVKAMIQIGGARKVILIDHHKTAIEDLAGLEEELRAEDFEAFCEAFETSDIEGKTYAEAHAAAYTPLFEMFTSMEMSGATLAWKYWVENEVLRNEDRPLLLGHIEDRDLWKFKLPLTREIQANVFSYEYTFENWDELMSYGTAALTNLASGGIAIERKHHKDIAELVSVCQRFIPFFPANQEVGGFHWESQEAVSVDIPIASLPYTFASDAGHLMAKNHQNGKWFAACYYDTADHRIFSLRSTEEGIDVSEVAKFYGGGGHKHAAGFKVARNHWLAQI